MTASVGDTSKAPTADRGGTTPGGATGREPTIIRRPLDHCPVCNSWQLRPVIDSEGVHFLCGSCNRCWHAELGYVTRVRPSTCDGCPQPDRCAATYAGDHASS